MNPRVREALMGLREAVEALERVLEDVACRDADPLFREAVRLFDEGHRLSNWGAPLTDTSNEVVLSRGGEEIGYWADGTSRRTEEAFGLLGVPTDDGDDILHYLSDLTEEERLSRRRSAPDTL
jgi:hypothetical protein